MSLNAHELSLLGFLDKQQSRRLRALLEKGGKGRKKFRDKLAHDVKFEKKFVRKIDSKFSSAEAVYNLLVRKGSRKTCFVLSEIPELDGREVELSFALSLCIGADAGTFLSLIPNKLGFFEYEDGNERFLLEKSGA